jgi:hypothetical protein
LLLSAIAESSLSTTPPRSQFDAPTRE